MGWAARTDISNSIGAFTSTEEFSSEVALNPGEIAHIHINAENDNAAPSFDAVVQVWAANTDAAAGATDLALVGSYIMPFPAAQDGKVYLGFLVSGFRRFKVGIASAGTDGWTLNEMYSSKDGINA